MVNSSTRRGVLRTGGFTLVGALAGCSGVVSEAGNASSLNLRVANELPERHELRLRFVPGQAQEDAFEKTVELDPGGEKIFKNAVPYPSGTGTATATAQLDDRRPDRLSDISFSKKLERLGATAERIDGSLRIVWLTRNRSGDGFF